MQVTTSAIVFSAIKYSDNSLIVSCFTKKYGLKSYLLRGILKSKKGKLRTSFFQPLTQLQLEAVHKNKGQLERITEAKIIQPYKTLHTEVKKTAIVLFISEVLKNAIQEKEQNQSLYHYISQALVWLDNNVEMANFHILFLINLSSYLGFYPDLSQSKAIYFNLQEGNFQNNVEGNYSIKGEHIEHLKLFFGIGFDEVSTIKLTKNQRVLVLDLLLLYYQLHLQGFKKPKSLLVLNQLFI